MHRPTLALAATLAALTIPADLSAQALVNGGSIDATLTTAGQTNVHTFFANGGEGFQVQVWDRLAGALDPRVQVFDPTGAVIGTRVNYPGRG